ncbi:MAG TPA: PIN domain nuclease, partial [Thermoanaerobaculia bacterium]
TLRPVQELTPAALALALRTGRSVPECLYLTLAVQGSCPLVTADRELYDALAAGPLAGNVLWIGDFT